MSEKPKDLIPISIDERKERIRRLIDESYVSVPKKKLRRQKAKSR